MNIDMLIQQHPCLTMPRDNTLIQAHALPMPVKELATHAPSAGEVEYGVTVEVSLSFLSD
jgi:hypothetical protein